ncbi:MAG: tetratricopeptide repeat protein [Smithellaceae bacterium]
MNRPYLKIIILTFCAFFLITFNDAKEALAELQTNQFQSYLKLGIKKAFNLEFSNANVYLQKAVELEPENPTGYAFLSMITLFAYEMSFDENIRKNNQDSMLRYVDETLARGEKRIQNNPTDSKAYLAMAMAKTARFNWANQQKHYVSMAREASDIWEYLEKAKESDPQNYDLYFLMGSFRYHIDHLPRLTRFLSSLIITSGDRLKGLQELELAAQKGDLLKQLALSELSSNYLNFEKQPARALPIIRKLKEAFPNNYNFSFALANALSDLHRFDDAFNIARELEKNIRSGIPPFAPQLRPRYDQLMGRIFFTQGDYDKAEESLQRALKDTTPYNARIRAWAFLRLGMISDARNERKKAQEYYSQALDVKEGAGAAQIEAQKYLETPYMPSARN